MPKVKFDHVVSFSSEDPSFPANNILSNDPTKKWKCQTAGEKSAIVILQLEKPTLINAIDIGNESSAYIEVLVSKLTMDEFKILLVMSSFMSPLEARQGKNINKVRMFKFNDLSSPEKNEKWDRIKIVCTQPFNRHVQYGLSFITLYTNENQTVTNGRLSDLGNFKMRPESPDNLSVSLFAKQSELKKDEALKGAALIRQASSASDILNISSPAAKLKNKLNKTPKPIISNDDEKEKVKMQPRNRNELLYQDDEEAPNEKIDKVIEKKLVEVREKEKAKEIEKEKEKERQKKEKEKQREKRKEETKKEKVPVDNKTPQKKLKVEESSSSSSKRLSEKRKIEEGEGSSSKKFKKKEMKTLDFNKLMNGVVLVISGIQNPDRSNLRTMALEMGAKYKPDWDNNCTHLICAFMNTPKFNQVKGKGKIVTRKWIEDCYSQRKRFPWRRYALDGKDKKDEESEEEIHERIESPPTVPPQQNNDSDTEEEIERIQAQNQTKPEKEPSRDSPYSKDTDEEILTFNSNVEETDSTGFLQMKRIHIDQSFSKNSYDKLQKFIFEHNGVLVDDPIDEVNIIITNTINSKTMKEINNKAICVSAEWLRECHDKKMFLPLDNYEV